MYTRRLVELVAVAAVLLGGYGYSGLGTGGRLLAEPPPVPSAEQGEVLNRGPVNEAFAEPVNIQVQAPLVVTKQPPAAIEEEPPAQRPEGGNFAWIPGYWAWDADRSDFIWVGACWRAAPPGRVWVPGYWAPLTEERASGRGGVSVVVGGISVQVGGGRPRTEEVIVGWEWIPGFWAPAGMQEIDYLPAPPAPEDLAPPGPAPQADVAWVPGCWYWRDGQYVRRPGYWLGEQPGWVWVPSHYIWTPRGYIFAEGHWDYSLDRRGVLFAPVYFSHDVYSRRGFRYSPTVVIDLGVMSGSFFTDPRYGHYYFGDYYDDAYLQAGIYPWFEVERNHSWYDPIYQYDRWRNVRTDARWADHAREDYDHRRADKNLRPPRTYRELETALPKLSEPQRKNFQMATPLSAAVSNKNSTMKFGQINAEERQNFTKQAADVHKFRDDRSKWETTASPTGKTPAGTPPPSPAGTVTGPKDHEVGHTPPPSPAGTVTGPKDHEVLHTPPPSPAGTVGGPKDHGPAYVPPPDVHLDKADRVKFTPPPPIVGKSAGPAGGGDKGPPPPPPDESKHSVDVKDMHKDPGGRRGG